MKDLKKLSLAKTVSWRIIATFITIIISFLILREIITSIALATILNIIKSTANFLHERTWDRVKWGRLRE